MVEILVSRLSIVPRRCIFFSLTSTRSLCRDVNVRLVTVWQSNTPMIVPLSMNRDFFSYQFPSTPSYPCYELRLYDSIRDP